MTARQARGSARFLIVGPQGSGKGTQGVLVAEAFGVPSISTGDVFRENIANGTADPTTASSRISTSVPPPTVAAVVLVCPASTFLTINTTWRSGPSALAEKPRSLGIWLSSTVSAMPFM